MALTRREFLKNSAAASAAAAVGMSIPSDVEAAAKKLRMIGDGTRQLVVSVELVVGLCLQLRVKEKTEK